MKRTLSSHDLWSMCQGLTALIEEQEREQGKSDPEDENLILLKALVDLASEKGFFILETIPFPINIKTEQQGGGYELSDDSWLDRQRKREAELAQKEKEPRQAKRPRRTT